MISKIINLVKQMSETEKESLLDHIKSQYALEERTGMLRDEIKNKIFEIIKLLFTDHRFIVQEHYNWRYLNMDIVDVRALSEALIIEFDLEQIEFAEIMKWEKISDAVSYIEDTLECALYDKEK